jgi:hypothetical protein
VLSNWVDSQLGSGLDSGGIDGVGRVKGGH